MSNPWIIGHTESANRLSGGDAGFQLDLGPQQPAQESRIKAAHNGGLGGELVVRAVRQLQPQPVGGMDPAWEVAAAFQEGFHGLGPDLRGDPRRGAVGPPEPLTGTEEHVPEGLEGLACLQAIPKAGAQFTIVVGQINLCQRGEPVQHLWSSGARPSTGHGIVNNVVTLEVLKVMPDRHRRQPQHPAEIRNGGLAQPLQVFDDPLAAFTQNTLSSTIPFYGGPPNLSNPLTQIVGSLTPTLRQL